VTTVHVTTKGSATEDKFTGRILPLAPTARLPPAYVYRPSINDLPSNTDNGTSSGIKQDDHDGDDVKVNSNAISPSSWVEEFFVWSRKLPCHGSAVPGEGDDESACVAEPSLQEMLNDMLAMASGSWPVVEMAYH
jgi:hypothetical protein